MLTNITSLIPAAPSGILSVKNGFEYIQSSYDKNEVVIFREATRPMISVDTISKLLQSCYDNGTTNICKSMRDYVHFTYVDSKAQYINRNSIVTLQSPEAYRISILENVFIDAAKK